MCSPPTQRSSRLPHEHPIPSHPIRLEKVTLSNLIGILHY